MTVAPLIAQIELTSANALLFGILSVLAGILILVWPRILNYIVAAWLIIAGVVWIVAAL